MRLYDCETAPSPRRARMFIAEKGAPVEILQVDLAGGAHLEPAFRALNPRCTVPVLQLDDGGTIVENVGIARYLEEMFPAPPLLGTTPYEKALVLEWNTRIEHDGFMAVQEAFRNKARGLAGRALTGLRNYEQIPALIERGRQRTEDFLAMLDDHLADRDFICGGGYSFADITATVAVDFCKWIKVPVPDEAANLRRWYEAMQARPSYTA